MSPAYRQEVKVTCEIICENVIHSLVLCFRFPLSWVPVGVLFATRAGVLFGGGSLLFGVVFLFVVPVLSVMDGVVCPVMWHGVCSPSWLGGTAVCG